MLIDHVDRMDTHLARWLLHAISCSTRVTCGCWIVGGSAVLQVHQEVDSDGGWPLEVLLPDGNVGEVYLQPGEMVLYEGAWLRHG